MDFCRNMSVSGGVPPEQQLLSPSSCSKLGSLDDLFADHSMEGDLNMEWLSIFVEDCLSSSGSCLPPQSTTPNAACTNTTAAEPKNHLSMHKMVVPCRARSKRKRTPTCWSQQHSDPPLLHQAYWLADSELIFPNKCTSPHSTSNEHAQKCTSPHTTSNGHARKCTSHKCTSPNSTSKSSGLIRDHGQAEGINGQGQKGTSPNSTSNRQGQKGTSCNSGGQEEGGNGQGQGQGRKCTHCMSQRTPQWRAGPEGPKTLCNACGVRYKSGRLLPEYRPAKSPTFVTYKHSNSHKKVLEMRMSLLPS